MANVIPATWTLNLSLPQMLAEMTTLEAAAMARRPSTAISRAITTKATHTFTRLVEGAFRHPGLPLRSGLVPPLTYRQLRRLARDLGFPLAARPGDLDATQWAGLHAFLSNTDDLGTAGRSP